MPPRTSRTQSDGAEKKASNIGGRAMGRKERNGTSERLRFFCEQRLPTTKSTRIQTCYDSAERQGVREESRRVVTRINYEELGLEK